MDERLMVESHLKRTASGVMPGARCSLSSTPLVVKEPYKYAQVASQSDEYGAVASINTE
jgi:hypothetical protein